MGRKNVLLFLKEVERQLLSDLNELCRNCNFADTNREEFLQFQSKLDELYLF